MFSGFVLFSGPLAGKPKICPAFQRENRLSSLLKEKTRELSCHLAVCRCQTSLCPHHISLVVNGKLKYAGDQLREELPVRIFLGCSKQGLETVGLKLPSPAALIHRWLPICRSSSLAGNLTLSSRLAGLTNRIRGEADELSSDLAGYGSSAGTNLFAAANTFAGRIELPAGEPRSSAGLLFPFSG